MSGVLAVLFGVVLLTDPVEGDGNPAGAAAERGEDRAERPVQAQAKERATSAKVTSRSSDFDTKAGVVMFEGDVVVRYSDNLTMCADRLYMFVAGSNELNRVVALGNVSISNELRSGSCERAVYRRRRGEIEMFGDGGGRKAVLQEPDGGRGLEGTRIRFWLDSGQVEVRDSAIVSETKGREKLL
ncbi:MAG: LptA/OstA family protein [Kiritimatiellia bacterium]